MTNNEPVPDNISVAATFDAVADTAIDMNAIAAEDWGLDGLDQCRISGGGVFSCQIKENRFFIHSTYIHSEMFSSFLPM